MAPREPPREPSLELARRRRAVPSSPRLDHSRFRFISASPPDNTLSWLWLGAPGTYEAQTLHTRVSRLAEVDVDSPEASSLPTYVSIILLFSVGVTLVLMFYGKVEALHISLLFASTIRP